MGFANALQNLAWMTLPSVIYLVVVRWRARITLSEILGTRLGLKLGNARPYGVAAAAAIPMAALGVWASSLTGGFKGSSIAPFVHAVPTAPVVAGAFVYAVLATGLPEELLFRGLIAGVLFRRMSFWRANTLQAVIFLLPHVLILLVAPHLWFLLPVVLGLAAVVGWLRHWSGSIWPGVIVHAASNVAGALAVMQW